MRDGVYFPFRYKKRFVLNDNTKIKKRLELPSLSLLMNVNFYNSNVSPFNLNSLPISNEYCVNLPVLSCLRS